MVACNYDKKSCKYKCIGIELKNFEKQSDQSTFKISHLESYKQKYYEFLWINLKYRKLRW